MADVELRPDLPTVKEFHESLLAAYKAITQTLGTGLPSFFAEAIKELMGALEGKIDVTAEDQWGVTLDYFVGAGLLNAEDRQDFMKLRQQPWFVEMLIYPMVVGGLIKAYLETKIYSRTGEYRQELLKEMRPELPDAGSAMQAAFVAPEKTGEVREIMKRLGLKDEHIDLMFLSRYRLYDENVIRDLFLREVLTDDEMFMRMRELGYTDTRIKEIIKTWELIPPVADLFMMVAKEAFEPEIYKKIGLEDEFPRDQVQWLEKQGLSEEWAKKYWIAHWDQPSIQQGFEMLHRDVIDDNDLDILFRAVEMPPYWRDKLTKIAYRPYTRVDVRRMADLGVLKPEQLVRAYMDQGYDREKATAMAEFTIRYNAQSDRDLTKGQILKGYRERAIPRDDAERLLIDLEISQTGAEYLLEFEDYMLVKEMQDDVIDNIKERYTQNLIELHDARVMLNNLNLPATQIDILLDRWELKKWKDIKMPSKSDLDKFFKTKIINEDTYTQQMKKLGYSAVYIRWYKEAALKKA